MDSTTVIQALRDYLPEYWQRSNISIKRRRYELDKSCELYRDVRAEIQKAGINAEIQQISVNENLLDYGQFLLRAQLLMKVENSTFYKVSDNGVFWYLYLE